MKSTQVKVQKMTRLSEKDNFVSGCEHFCNFCFSKSKLQNFFNSRDKVLFNVAQLSSDYLQIKWSFGGQAPPKAGRRKIFLLQRRLYHLSDVTSR